MARWRFPSWCRCPALVKGFYISDQLADMDIEAIHKFVSQTYWAKDIPQEIMRRGIENSQCFGVFTDSKQQVGFARLITDQATFAYLSDVYILEEFRGKGLSKWLLQTIMSHPCTQGLRRIGLATADAHGLYEQYDFKPLANPDYFMEVWKPDIYQK
jgi:N-acetylglutamate synthase-like GNAT family acetyltransferase